MKQRDGVKMLHQYVLIAKSLRKHDFLHCWLNMDY